MKCLTATCTAEAAAALDRGLCMKCYGSANAMVKSGKTTWDKLVELGMALPKNDLFATAFEERIKSEKA